MRFNELNRKEQQQVLNQANARLHIDALSIEKDWWVTTVLRAIFGLPYADRLSLKGGTSLSKCWNLISRFSEDADIGIDREFLGFTGELSKNQISDKLRRAACSFVREKMSKDIEQQLINDGLSADQFRVSVNITSVTTTDPEVVDVIYISCLDKVAAGEYINPKVKIEVSGRSMREPVADICINSLLSQAFMGTQIEESPFKIRAVLPERTFLEKVFLLHEEFAKGMSGVRVDRMSRHLYDIYKMMDSVSERAINDEHLYRSVIEHRRRFIGLKGFDYDTLYPEHIKIVPEYGIAEKWRVDYEKMQRYMIYGESPSFEAILEALERLNGQLRKLPYKKA